jgi:hypothetical protein
MKRISRRVIVLGAVLVLLATIFLVLHNCGVRISGNGMGNADTDRPGAVRIDGNAVEPVSPGVTVPLDLTFTNPHDTVVSITTLTVAVDGVDAPNSDAIHACPLDDFTVDQAPLDLRITLAARATNSLSDLGLPPHMWPHLGMVNRPVNQDGCKGASLTLTYTASGPGQTP